LKNTVSNGERQEGAKQIRPLRPGAAGELAIFIEGDPGQGARWRGKEPFVVAPQFVESWNW